jgi:hypothetical protein
MVSFVAEKYVTPRLVNGDGWIDSCGKDLP